MTYRYVDNYDNHMNSDYAINQSLVVTWINTQINYNNV